MRSLLGILQGIVILSLFVGACLSSAPAVAHDEGTVPVLSRPCASPFLCRLFPEEALGESGDESDLDDEPHECFSRRCEGQRITWGEGAGREPATMKGDHTHHECLMPS